MSLVLQGCSESSSGTPATGDGALGDGSVASGSPDGSVQVTRTFPRLTFTAPIGAVQVPGTNTWWVFEKAGRILRFTGQDPADAQLVVDLTDRVESGPGEAGLLGLAFHPQFAENGRVYVSYTGPGSPLVSVIARFDSRDRGLTLDTDSETPLLSLDQPYENHNGGHIVFGPDGFLYVGFGDGGSGGDPHGNGQNTNTLLGKILRLDVDNAAPYAIPLDNPFFSGGGRAEVWAYGLRNPWRFQFDAETGEIWAADAGQQLWEEIDMIIRGGNYGWNVREGAHCYAQPQCTTQGLIDPVAEYGPSEGCAVIGGFVYRGAALPLQGAYIYGDFCSGTIWALVREQDVYRAQTLAHTDLSITSFAQDGQGELLVIDMGGGIYALQARSQ